MPSDPSLIGRKTRIRAGHTNAADAFIPTSNESLSTDKEVEDRVKKHNRIYHGDRDQVLTATFEGKEIKSMTTYEGNKLASLSEFEFINGTLHKVTKSIYDTSVPIDIICAKVEKVFNFNADSGVFEGITTTKLI